MVEAVDYAGKLDPRVVEKHRLRGEFDLPEDQSIWPPPGPPTRPGTMPQ